ncbi:hypothetical protein B0H16DRAFT_1578006, partial [Mycena metata]
MDADGNYTSYVVAWAASSPWASAGLRRGRLRHRAHPRDRVGPRLHRVARRLWRDAVRGRVWAWRCGRTDAGGRWGLPRDALWGHGDGVRRYDGGAGFLIPLTLLFLCAASYTMPRVLSFPRASRTASLSHARFRRHNLPSSTLATSLRILYTTTTCILPLSILPSCITTVLLSSLLCISSPPTPHAPIPPPPATLATSLVSQAASATSARPLLSPLPPPSTASLLTYSSLSPHAL